jgi:hypothetical protein
MSDQQYALCVITEWGTPVTEWGRPNRAEDVPLVRHLRAQGYRVDGLPFHAITDERLAPYDAIIIPEYPQGESLTAYNLNWRLHPETLHAAESSIRRFVEAGGGLVLYGVCFFQGLLNGMQQMNRLLAPWEAEVLYEQVLDERHAYVYPLGEIFNQYAWTTNITPHLLTEGVHGVFYPTNSHHGPMTVPFRLSSEWSVLVSGMPSARSVPANPADMVVPFFFTDHQGTYVTSPPLVAIRSVGQGRVAVIGMSPVLAFFGVGHAGYGDVMLSRGDGQHPSNFGLLQERLYAWAAEPLHGTHGDSRWPTDDYAPPPPPIDWTQFSPGPSPTVPRRGLIGARTQRTGGSGSVADYVAAAAEAGLDFIGITEDFAQLTPECWDAVKAECAQASTERVLAVPGFFYRDAVGARWIALGECAYPDAHHCSDDGRRILVAHWILDALSPLTAPIDIGHNPRPAWTYAAMSAMAVRTYEHGILIDDALEAYLERQEIEDVVAPLVVDLIDAPAEVARSSAHWTGVLLSPDGVIRLNMMSDQRPLVPRSSAVSLREQLRLAFARHGLGGEERFFAGEGPMIIDWRGFNNVRAVQGCREPIAGHEQFVLHAAVESPAGLREITLYDGPHRLRRYTLAGETSYTLTCHLPHDRQRHLVLVATDQLGRQTLSAHMNSADLLFARNMCRDRSNTTSLAVLRQHDGRVFICGPATPYQRKTTMWPYFNPGFANPNGDHAAPYVDGGGGSLMSHGSLPELAYADIPTPEGIPASRMANPLACRDAIIQESDLIGWYANPRASAWVAADPVEEAPLYTATIRWTDFGKNAGDPGVTLVEGELVFLRDGVLDPRHAVNPQVLRMFGQCNESTNAAFSAVGLIGGDCSGAIPEGTPVFIAGELQPGGFITFYPSRLGAVTVMALDPGYQVVGEMQRPTSLVRFGLPLGGRTVRKGERVHYRLLATRGRVHAPPTDREWRDFAGAMGIGGDPAYQVTVRHGHCVGTNFLLDLESEGGYVRVDLTQAHLPIRLPVRVAGLNPVWGAWVADIARDTALPLGIIEREGVGYTTCDLTRGNTELFVGHPVICDRPDVPINALPEGEIWRVELHNPHADDIPVVARGTDGFPPLARFRYQGVIPAGASVVVRYEGSAACVSTASGH